MRSILCCWYSLFYRLLNAIDMAVGSIDVEEDEMYVVNGRMLSVAVVCPGANSSRLALRAQRSMGTLDLEVGSLQGDKSLSQDVNTEPFAEFVLPREAVSFQPEVAGPCPYPVAEFVLHGSNRLFAERREGAVASANNNSYVRSPVVSATIRERPRFDFQTGEARMMFRTTEVCFL